ncbi:MAG: metal ABC transporter substrate-binding protein [Vulcanococcus sp.]|jgi:zinc/manganese transport system substrate-binding protein|uniref:metal ABC transporter substrate-binding protein n=1 Tax=Vulcanococcus sp. TaxID=2856995 RepID=UPI0025F99BCD|nr:metal ABC transporter substrate-binding protein [Vulcanococcus sp.]MBW0175094.1 metal ABC transporter substrate-binding protein [Vulcanococcus sp.]MBW0179524.1 metal ABC transporter substrate-binding protein [Vulcanococcus sp.]
MRRTAAVLLAPLALAAVQACSPSSQVDVIAADGALCDITRRLAASSLKVDCLLGPSDDPHQLQLTPAQTRQINQAKLLLINGYGLTPALDKLSRAVKVAEIAVPNSPDLNDGGHGDKHSQAEHEHNHAHEDNGEAAHLLGDQDPHVWHDPRQAAAMVKLVRQKLEQLNPQAAAQIQARSEAMQRSLNALDRWNREQFSTVPPPRVLASGHRAFASLARAYQLKELPVIDATSTSEALRPQALANVVAALRNQGARSLFAEQTPASKALLRISSLSGVPLASHPLRADSAGDNLMATLTTNTCLIVNALGGRCNQASAGALVASWNAIR